MLEKPWPPEARGCPGCVEELRGGLPSAKHTCGADNAVELGEWKGSSATLRAIEALGELPDAAPELEAELETSMPYGIARPNWRARQRAAAGARRAERIAARRAQLGEDERALEKNRAALRVSLARADALTFSETVRLQALARSVHDAETKLRVRKALEQRKARK